jgi:hypothetical protein
VKDLRLYVHSFNIRMLGLIPYTVNGEMHFYWVSDEKCMSRSQVDTLKREFMDLLQNQASMRGHMFGQEEPHESKTETIYHRTYRRGQYCLLRQAGG